MLYASWMRPDLDCFSRTELYLRSMFEASRLPAGWASRLNLARALIAPTPFVADVFRASGVTVPVEVVPDGIDPAAYPCLDRPGREGVTTLIVSAVYNRLYDLPGIADRKHLPEAIAAWQQAFDGDAAARLILKCRFGRREDFPADPRIILVAEEETTRGIAHWYQQADVLLALGNEGFGLPLIEGMATGLPVIALASEGQAAVCREAGGLVLAVPAARWERHLHEGREPCGVRGVPAIADVGGPAALGRGPPGRGGGDGPGRVSLGAQAPQRLVLRPGGAGRDRGAYALSRGASPSIAAAPCPPAAGAARCPPAVTLTRPGTAVGALW